MAKELELPNLWAWRMPYLLFDSESLSTEKSPGTGLAPGMQLVKLTAHSSWSVFSDFA